MLRPFDSKGHKKCYEILKELGVKRVCRERPTESLPNRRFDYKFKHNNKKYIVEYDGEQHFVFTSIFHGTHARFDQSQNIDVIKTLAAMIDGYIIIRIAFCDINNAANIFKHVFNSNLKCYFSDTEKYTYITNSLVNIH